MNQLEGRIAVVTGAARGIGQAIALELARRGADLALCDLKAEWLEETAGLATELGRTVKCYSTDVSIGDQVQDTVKAIVGDFGRLDILVNNAGITKDGFLARMTEADWDAVLDINLKGTFLFTKAASKPMMKQRSGSVVNVASIIGLIGNAGQCNYAASKAGVIAFSKSSARELARRNIRVNAVAPGFIRTKMTEELPEEVRDTMLANIPSNRFGEPEDVARVVAFLAGDEAAYVTGQVLAVCGGLTMC